VTRIISPVRYETRIGREHVFHIVGVNPRHGFYAFPLHEDGRLRYDNADAHANYAACRSGVVRGEHVIDQGIIERTVEVRHSAVLRCDCGEHMHLNPNSLDLHTCYRCKRHYNSAGQELVDPDLWGEETGERFSDLLIGTHGP
jgi:hypothetical protein